MTLSAVSPLHAPPDEWQIIDLPAPPSLNKVRRFDVACHTKLAKWERCADNFVIMAKARKPPLRLQCLRLFEVHITLSEAHTGMDLDNSPKVLIDYLKRIEAIVDDAKKNMRRVTIEWGEAPNGCRVRLRPWRPS